MNENMKEKLKRYDLHIHTYNSKCANLKPKTILKKAKEKGLDGIAVTDHDTIKGALEVAAANDDPDFEVILGEEVSTDKGEVLAYYIKENIRPGNFYDVINEIKRQGGIAVIAHPYSIGIIGRKNADIENVVKEIDAIEGQNSRSFFKFENLKSQIKATEMDLPMTAGSDAHFAFEIGKSYTEFKGDLREALAKHSTKIYGTHWHSIFARGMTFFQKYIFRHL